MQCKICVIYGIVIAFLFLPAPLYAAAITNLTDQPKTLLMQRAGGFDPVKLEAGSTWRIVGQVTLLIDGREIVIEDKMEYAIWPGDIISPQRNLRGGQKF